MKKKMLIGYAALTTLTTVAMVVIYYSAKGKVVEYKKANPTATAIPTSTLPKSWVA